MTDSIDNMCERRGKVQNFNSSYVCLLEALKTVPPPCSFCVVVSLPGLTIPRTRLSLLAHPAHLRRSVSSLLAFLPCCSCCF